LPQIQYEESAMRIIIRVVNETEIELEGDETPESLRKAFKAGTLDVVEFCAERGLSGSQTYTVKEATDA